MTVLSTGNLINFGNWILQHVLSLISYCMKCTVYSSDCEFIL